MIICKLILFLVIACQVSAEYGVLYVQSTRSNNNNSHFCFAYNPDFKVIPTEFNTTDQHELVNLLPSHGCIEEEDVYIGRDVRNKVVAVSRDNCTFVEKARLAQKHHAFAVLVVTSTSLIVPGGNKSAGDFQDVNIVVGLVMLDDFHKMLNLGEPITVWMYDPVDPKMDPNMVLMFLIALLCIVVGAYWSGVTRYSIAEKIISSQKTSGNSTESKNDSHNQEEPETLNVSVWVVLVLFVVICTMMVLLYFFYDYLEYVVIYVSVYMVIALFCVAGAVGLYSCLCPLWVKVIPANARIPPNRIPLCNEQPEIRNIVLGLLCVGFSVFWAVERKASYSWILQDILGVAFCINMMNTVRLPNLKACTVLLVLLFFYDIFFVFITPLFTKNGSSVMIDVATGGNSHTGEQLPMVFKVPRLLSPPDAVCASPYSLLGFGDIIVPGLLISFNHGFDLIVKSKRIYFIASTIAYIVGLAFTYTALALMETGQPALLYLVPCTLLTTTVIACKRGELSFMWSGKECSKKIDDVRQGGQCVPSSVDPNSESSSMSSDGERRGLINA